MLPNEKTTFFLSTENPLSDVKSGLAERPKWRHFQKWTLGNNSSVHRSHNAGTYIFFFHHFDIELEITVCQVS